MIWDSPTWDVMAVKFILNEDRSEMYNLAEQYPDKVKDMVARYEEWEKDYMVVPRPK